MSWKSVIPAIASRQPALTAFRRDIHAHPELAFAEHRTAERVAAELAACGIEVHRGVGRTGVVGVLRAGTSKRSLALRADMDALPIQELNDFSHRSKHTGCMHACGHDGHTTMLLGAAQYLAASRQFDGTVVFVFQPAEEGEGGAPAMIADGFFERFPVQAIFGMHNWPDLPPGKFAVAAGPVMASTDTFEIVLTGFGAHAAMPHQGVDPILAGAQLVQALQAIASRQTDPLDAVVAAVTQFHAGEADNVIPATATLRGTVRALSPEVRAATEGAIRQIVTGVAQACRVTAQIRYHHGYPPTVNSEPEARFCFDVARDLVGEADVQWGRRPSMGAEDFAYFLERSPGCYVWIGNGGGDGLGTPCGLHNPRYDFNDNILTLGANYWVNLVEKFLSV